ncbi:MAG: arylamine N-acetyltransferase [Anaerolineales bacterium]|nr:arylamine N-acetyltransferase [Anaerolineales bacterium]
MVDAYLDRIDYHGPRAPTLEALSALHQAHLLAVPFENLDIISGTPIVLEEERLFDKLVRRQRGGFCYELNGLFATLLRALGYGVTLLSARGRAGQEFGPEYDHLTLSVAGGQLPEPYLADVGFGECFREPLPLADGAEVDEGLHAYRLAAGRAEWRLETRRAGGAWEPTYAFTLQPRQMSDFEPMCRHHQTSPQSHFTRGRIWSIATRGGRWSLSSHQLVITHGSQREERPIQSEAEFWEVLREKFRVEAL